MSWFRRRPFIKDLHRYLSENQKIPVTESKMKELEKTISSINPEIKTKNTDSKKERN